jgi:glutathione S-transferase
MANMKFYYTPGSCTTGIHILLEEIGLVFEAYLVNLLDGDQRKPDFVAMNPKSSIPLLVREDGRPLTEFQAIAYWLARSHPKAKLMPGDVDGDTLVLETMDYVVGTIHMQGFARIFTTPEFCADEMHHDAVKAKGREIIDKGFEVINEVLGDKSYVAGDFSIADAALFYVEFWAVKTNIPLPENCIRHYESMRERPVVQQVLLEEGYREY